MKNLKHKTLGVLVPLFTSALLLSACGASAGSIQADTVSSDTETVSQDLTSAYTDTTDSTGISGSTGSGERSDSTGSSDSSVSAVALSAESAKDSDTVSEAFSDRDLSGEYDAAGAVTVSLNGTGAEASSESVQISGSTVTITAAGTYILSGTLDDGTVIVDASKDDKVQLVLDGVSIESSDFAAIYVRQADKVFITLAEGTVNTLVNGGTFTLIDENDVNAVVFAKDDITFNGTGTLRISSPAGNGISGKDEVTIASGTYEIAADGHAIRAKDSLAIADGSFKLYAVEDGLHAENSDDDTLGSIYIAGGNFEIEVKDDAVHANSLLQIDGGTFSITAAEGLEATYIRINGGDVRISASDDGVNAAYKSSAYTPTFEMNDGTLTVVMGSGDTDGIDSNGNIVVNGGTIDVTGQSSFDCDGSAQYNGGTIIVNGQQVSSIPSQMMGGGFGGEGFRGGMGGGRRR